MSTRNISWGVKAAYVEGWQPYYLHVPIVLKSWGLSLLEPSWSVQACSGIASMWETAYYPIWMLSNCTPFTSSRETQLNRDPCSSEMLTQYRAVISYRRFGTTYGARLQGSRNPKRTFEDGTRWIVPKRRKVAAWYHRIAQISSASRRKPKITHGWNCWEDEMSFTSSMRSGCLSKEVITTDVEMGEYDYGQAYRREHCRCLQVLPYASSLLWTAYSDLQRRH